MYIIIIIIKNKCPSDVKAAVTLAVLVYLAPLFGPLPRMPSPLEANQTAQPMLSSKTVFKGYTRWRTR